MQSEVEYLYVNGGVPTRHTHKWDGLHTRHLLESTYMGVTTRVKRCVSSHFRSPVVRLQVSLCCVCGAGASDRSGTRDCSNGVLR